MYYEHDDRDECEDCGGPCDVIEMGRKWCRKCWEQFKKEYSGHLLGGKQ